MDSDARDRVSYIYDGEIRPRDVSPSFVFLPERIGISEMHEKILVRDWLYLIPLVDNSKGPKVVSRIKNKHNKSREQKSVMII